MCTAITTANNNIGGARMSKGNSITITSYKMFMSLVMRVVSNEELNLSRLENENSCILLNTPLRSSAEKPTEGVLEN
jgi:hypothetical protein